VIEMSLITCDVYSPVLGPYSFRTTCTPPTSVVARRYGNIRHYFVSFVTLRTGAGMVISSVTLVW
jgi:hypothetical protein